MICEKCRRDREAGYKLGGLFFCIDCGYENVASLVGAGIGEAVDFTVDTTDADYVIDAGKNPVVADETEIIHLDPDMTIPGDVVDDFYTLSTVDFMEKYRENLDALNLMNTRLSYEEKGYTLVNDLTMVSDPGPASDCKFYCAGIGA